MQSLTRALIVTLFPALVPFGAAAQSFIVDAGPDVVLECEGADGAEYTLNGSVPAGPDVTFMWSTAPPLTLEDDDTLTPTGQFPVGETIVTLDASDAVTMESGTDSETVSVEDTQPAVVQATASPKVLWPPNHTLQEVTVRIRVRDACSAPGDLQVELLSAESNEPDNGHGDGNTTGDIQDAQIGTDDRTVLLRAERSGPGRGRVYTLTYRVTDAAGNETEAEAKVYVPHGFADVKHRMMDDMDGDPGDMANICPRPDAAADQFIDALPSLASFQDFRTCERACRAWYRGCTGIVGGTARCVRSEEAAVARLEAAVCKGSGDRSEQRVCRGDLRAEYRASLEQLARETAAGSQTCDSVGRRCANACGTLFDPNGSDYDDEGMTGP